MNKIRKIFFLIKEFISWFGNQNDYLYPIDENDKHHYPFKKAHWYKTRFGFKTSWDLAKAFWDIKNQ
jgi:hypothetical protein